MEHVLYTIGETATIFSVSPNTIREWIRTGKLRAVLTPGGRKRVHESEIERFLPKRKNPEAVSKKKMSEATRKTLEKFGIL